MTSFANDLHQPGDQITLNHSTALMAARTERAKELVRLFGMARRSFVGIFSSTAKTSAQNPANSNKIEKHDLAA